MYGFAMHGVHVGSLETFTDLRGNPKRAMIIGGNEADDTVDLSVFPNPSKRRCRRLGREAVAPSGAVKDPAEIDTGPWSLRMVKTHTADHVPSRLLDDRPVTVSAPLPLAEHVLGVLQRKVETARWFNQRDLLLLHDLRIPEDAHQGLYICQLRHAQHEARCFDRSLTHSWLVDYHSS